MSDPSPLRIGQILNGSPFSELRRVETIRPAGRDAGPAGLVGLQKEVSWRLPSLAIRFPRCSTDRATADKHNLKWVTSGRPLFDALRIPPTRGAIGWWKRPRPEEQA
jgi:hypothetical protein